MTSQFAPQCPWIWASQIKNPSASAGDVGDMGSIPGSVRPLGGGNDNSLHYSCLEKSHGQRRLLGCSPGGCKESDATEQLSIHMPRRKKSRMDHRECEWPDGESQFLSISQRYIF